MPPGDRPGEPWLSFLTNLDAHLTEPADFHCIGGFVVSQYYGMARQTVDLDVLTVIPWDSAEEVLEFAGKGSVLQKKHGIYVDYVRVANYPADYEDRLVRAFPIWPNVRLWALEPHDLALTKLERSSDGDTLGDDVFSPLFQRDLLVIALQQQTGLAATSRRAVLVACQCGDFVRTVGRAGSSQAMH